MDERRGGPTSKDAAAAERDYNREAETESGKRSCRSRDTIRDSWRVGVDELKKHKMRVGKG